MSLSLSGTRASASGLTPRLGEFPAGKFKCEQVSSVVYGSVTSYSVFVSFEHEQLRTRRGLTNIVWILSFLSFHLQRVPHTDLNQSKNENQV